MAKTLKEYLDWQAAQLKSASEFLKWDKGHEFLKWQKRWTGEKWQKRWTGEDVAPPTQSEPAPPAPVPSEPPTKAVTRPKSEPPPALSTRRMRARSLKQRMAETIIGRFYPDGEPTDSTATVHKRVVNAWRAECKAENVDYFEPPGWDSINRYLGRGSKT